MALEVICGAHTVYAVWGQPRMKDIIRIEKELAAARKKAGRPVLYVTRVPEDAPAPESDVRKYLNSRMTSIASYCSAYHVVMEGGGFFAAMKRAVLTTLFQIVGQRGMFHVHASITSVTRSVNPAELKDLNAILKLADGRGLVNGKPPVSVPPIIKGASMQQASPP